MRRLILFALMLMLQLSAMAQSRQKFNPARFEADLEQYVTTEAGLSAKDAAAFFPIYKENEEKATHAIHEDGQISPCRLLQQ